MTESRGTIEARSADLDALIASGVKSRTGDGESLTFDGFDDLKKRRRDLETQLNRLSGRRNKRPRAFNIGLGG